MGEVECLIRLYGMLAGLGLCYLLAGGCRWHGAKSFLAPAEVGANKFGRRNNYFVAKWLRRRALTAKSPGSIPRRSQILTAKQTPIPAISNRFPGGETYQF